MCLAIQNNYFTISFSAKCGNMIVKDLMILFDKKYHSIVSKNFKYHIEPFNNYNFNKKHINYLLIRNPYTRIVSSFYAMTNYDLLKRYNSLYNTFEEFINIIYKEFKTNKYFILGHNVVNLQSNMPGIKFLNLNNIKPIVFETEELNLFIEDFNKNLN